MTRWAELPNYSGLQLQSYITQPLTTSPHFELTSWANYSLPKINIWSQNPSHHSTSIQQLKAMPPQCSRWNKNSFNSHYALPAQKQHLFPLSEQWSQPVSRQFSLSVGSHNYPKNRPWSRSVPLAPLPITRSRTSSHKKQRVLGSCTLIPFIEMGSYRPCYSRTSTLYIFTPEESVLELELWHAANAALIEEVLSRSKARGDQYKTILNTLNFENISLR